MMDKVALEIAKRSVKHNMTTLLLRELVLKAVEGVFEKSDVAIRVHSIPTIVMLQQYVNYTVRDYEKDYFQVTSKRKKIRQNDGKTYDFGILTNS